MQFSQPAVRKIIAWIAIILTIGALIIVELTTHSFWIDGIVSGVSGLVLACIVKLARPHRAHTFLRKYERQLAASTAGTSDHEKTIGQTFATIVTPLLAISGLLIYSIFSQAYDRFYGGLGVNPGDVGWSYANTVASAAGALILIIFLSAPFALTYLLGTFAFWMYEITPLDRSQRYQAIIRRTARETSGVFVISFVFVFAYIFYTFSANAAIGAQYISDGLSFDSVQVGPVIVFAPHADTARVEEVPEKSANQRPTSRTKTRATIQCGGGIDEISNRPILFLGETSSTAVFYDPECRRAVYAPTNSVVISLYKQPGFK